MSWACRQEEQGVCIVFVSMACVCMITLLRLYFISFVLCV